MNRIVLLENKDTETMNRIVLLENKDTDFNDKVLNLVKSDSELKNRLTIMETNFNKLLQYFFKSDKIPESKSKN
jgi:hypothetical protein